MEISKETIYNGYRFRSRLEARWAVFFDKLRIPYQYEPEAFVCEDGSQYTPDFFLPNSYLRDKDMKGLYLEIKYFGWNDPSQRLYLHRIGTAMPNRNLVLICGDPVDATNTYEMKEGNEELSPGWDNYMMIVYCEKCGVLKASFSIQYMYCPCCDGKVNGERTLDAALAARQFRFQYHK